MREPRSAPARPFWDRIQTVCATRGWSTVRLERESGVSRTTINKWKTQPRKPLAATVNAVADALDIDRVEALELAGILNAEETGARVEELEAQLAAERERRTEIEQEFAAYKARQRAEDESRGKAG